ncbi:MAG: proline dehydrogenase family protein [Candidatus Omnitrophica bacterium]|nr:proline dehydrogenase family protein [Candidatus Omnitrophota bacterium]
MAEGCSSTETGIRKIGAQLDASMREASRKITQAHPWETQILRWCLTDDSLRTQILRFIDCLPALKNPRQIVRHLKEYFPEENKRLPWPLRIGVRAASPSLLTGAAVAAVTRRTTLKISRLFLAGANLEEAFATIGRLEEQGFQVSVDLLGEATTSEAEAEAYTQRYLELLQRWNQHLPSHPHISLKLSSLAFPFDPVDPERCWRQVQPRLTKILQAAAAQKGFVNVDMEQYHLRDLILWLTQRILDEIFPEETEVGLVIQSYLKDSEQVLQKLLGWITSRGRPVTVRLVRGAYWDSEVILARQQQWPCPVYIEKSETDACFERLTDSLLENHSKVRAAIATHNLRSIARAIVKAQELKVPQDRWECQVLYGMGEAVQQAVQELGIPVRIYTPVGELLPGMAYLVRRILENTSHASFLAANLLEKS